MLIIGEKINSSIKRVNEAILNRDSQAIIDIAKKQADAGANFLEVNCGTLDTAEEPAAMEWLARLVQESTQLPLCIDSPNANALEAGLKVHKGQAMINSISGETERFKQVLPLVKKYDAKVVALCLDDRGIPEGSSAAIAVGMKLVNDLVAAGIPLDRIYLDPLVRTQATSPTAVIDTLAIMQALGATYQGLHFVSGLSNVSYGLPERRHLNRAYVAMSISAGLDAVIMDPTDAGMHAQIYAAEALMNKDRFCLAYIKAGNAGKLKV